MKDIKEWLPLMGAVIALLIGVKLLVANPIESRLDRMEGRLIQAINEVKGKAEDMELETRRIRETLIKREIWLPGRVFKDPAPSKRIQEDPLEGESKGTPG